MIITLTGNNHFQILQKLSEIIGKFTKQYGELAIEKLDGEEMGIERINESLQNLPFLIPKKLVVLRDPSKNKQFADNIEQIIGSLPNTTEAIIVEPKIDKRSSYFKVLKAKTDFKEFNELDIFALAGWVVEEAKKNEGRINRSDAQYLVERVGLNQELLFNELDKLLLYDKNITRQTIDLLTEPNPQSSIFDLLDASFNGNYQKTLAIYHDQRRQRVEPLAIMAMITWQLHILAIIKAADKKSVDQIAKEAKLNPFVVRKGYQIAHNLSLNDLKKLLDQALKLDLNLKSKNIDADEAMQHFLLSLFS